MEFSPETVSENHLSVNDPFESNFEFRRGAADTVKGFFGKKLSENVLNAFIFTTNENQNKILDLGKGRLAAGLNLTEICHKRLILINIRKMKNSRFIKYSDFLKP